MPPSKAGDFTINSVGVVIGYKTKKGIEEVVHQIDGEEVTITSCQHEVVKKMRQVKEEGQVVGYEPTGEETLVIKVKYIRE
jgi:hypothetical protein